MKYLFKDNLKHTMGFYFLLIILASILVGVEFILDIQSENEHLKQILLNNTIDCHQQTLNIEQFNEPLIKLRNKAILMFLIIMVIIMIVANMFINTITNPLQHMIEISKKISEGDLTKEINIYEKNELSELGETINEMSANLQEVSLLSQNIAGCYHQLFDKSQQLKSKETYSREEVESIIKQIEQVNGNFALLDNFIKYFHFSSPEIKQK